MLSVRTDAAPTVTTDNARVCVITLPSEPNGITDAVPKSLLYGLSGNALLGTTPTVVTRVAGTPALAP